ncbi:pumilio homolog 24 [Tanacetum coccineum]
MEFKVGDMAMLKVSPWKGVMQFIKRGKLNPRYVGPFKVLAKVRDVAYTLELTQELSRVHHSFHVSNLKKCYADEPLAMPLEGVHIDDTLLEHHSQVNKARGAQIHWGSLFGKSCSSSKGCIDDLFLLEEESGNFLNAAMIARSWGDLSKEANLLEKAGEFQEVAMCLIWYVLFRVAWGDGNRGWPLKQFDQMEEICNKVKSLAKRISKAGCMIWMVVAKVLPGAFKITVHLGKIHEIASSHVSCRVLQTYAKYCSQDERNAVNQKLKPHFLTLACSTYAVYLITKMLDNASKEQVAEFISSLHGHNQSLLMELYSTELQLFKNLGQLKERRLVDIIAKLNSSSEAYVSCVATDFRKRNNRSLLLTQGNCGTSAADVIQHVSSALLIRMIHTKDRSKIGILCIKHGSAQRDKNIKGMKDNISKIALDRFGSMVLACILSIVNDILLVKKAILRELQTVLKELILNKVMLLIVNFNVILEWKTPFVAASSYQLLTLSYPDVLSLLDSSVPPLVATIVFSNSSDAEGDEDMNDANETLKSAAGGKKDLALRRRELLVDSGLAEVPIVNYVVFWG